MFKLIRLYAFFLVLIPVSLGLQSSNAGETKSADGQEVYEGLESILYRLVDSSDHEGLNIFFTSLPEQDKEFIYIYWREGRIIWIADLPPAGSSDLREHWEDVILRPRGGTKVDLSKDITRPSDTLNSSTYTVDRQWILETVYEAVAKGSPILITISED